jgi:hypothetical protein
MALLTSLVKINLSGSTQMSTMGSDSSQMKLSVPVIQERYIRIDRARANRHVFLCRDDFASGTRSLQESANNAQGFNGCK